MNVSAEQLLPTLRSADWTTRRGLSDDGFSDSLAFISLSRELCASFHCDGRDVSYRGLGELDLSAQQAWDTAAHNLINRAYSAEGIQFRTRAASLILSTGAPGIQVATQRSNATDWLAHPRTFTILDNHLSQLLGEELTYLLPTSAILLALPSRDCDNDEWVRQAASLAPPGQELLTAPIKWGHGFPTVVPTLAVTHA